jgi:hypothetical protein
LKLEQTYEFSFRHSIQRLLLYYIRLTILIEDPAALVVPAVLDPLMFREAYADHSMGHRLTGIQNAAGVVAANLGVQVKVALENNDIANCLVVTGEWETE